MKTAQPVAWSLLSLSLSLCAQTEPPTAGSRVEAANSHQIVERGAHHRVWSKVSWAANPLGVLEPQTNSYTELATGLHYRDGSSGEWRESDPRFELNEKGYAVAAKCQHQVIIAPSLNPADGVVVDLQTPEGRRLRSGLLGLNLFDPVSGKSLQIAAVRDVAGTQVSDTEVVWFDAFEGLQADVRVRNERGAFHQDVLLRERLSAEQLQRLGFDAATVRLEVWTEFVGSPEPALERRVMDAGTNGTFGAAGPAAATDERVDFGVMRMEWGSGKAFAEPEAGSTIRIFKEWQKLEGRQFLIESAGHEELRPLLESLPVKSAALDSPAPAARVALHRAPPVRSASGRITEAQSIQTAQLNLPSSSGAVVLDYEILNSGITDYTFRGDRTYYLSAGVTASGTTTFESGAVLKYAANASLNFYAPGVINWQAAPYRPCLFTAKDDNSVGENISGSTGNPAFGAYANPALNLLNYQGGTLSHFRVAYAQKAIAYHSVWLTFQDGQIVNCAKGISFGQGVATVRNMLFANVQYAFSELGYCTISAEHVTFGGRDNYPYTPAFLAVPAVWSYPYGINLKNCIMARLNTFAQGSAATQTGEHNGFWKNSNPPFGTSPTYCPDGTDPFADGGAGDHYLAQNSPFRDVGWATVNPGLAEALRQRTTTPPILHANVTWNSGNLPDLSRRSIRDDDFMPDLGYHYEVLDYIFHDLQTSTTVRLEGGVAVGVQGSETGWGLRLQDGGHVECVGSPGNMNRIVSFQNVQELPPPVATTGYTARPGNVWLYHSGGTDATRRMVFRFTDIAVGQGIGGGTVLSVAGVAPFAEVTFQDCRVRGGLVSVFLVQVNGPRSIRWVNNIWERGTPRALYYAGSNPSPYHQHPVTVDCRNNLFRDSYLPLVYQAANGTTGIWEVKDNLFDQTGNVATTDSAGAVLMQRSHNAATAGTVNNLGGTWYRTDLLRDYDVLGPLGEYYYPSSGGPYSLAQLRDAGSRSALAAGLACATTHTDHQPDVGMVDIGFHYRVPGDPPMVSDLYAYTCSSGVMIDLQGSLVAGCVTSYEIVSPPQNGELSGNPPSVTYHPDDHFEGLDSFTYKVSDGVSESQEATVWITVDNYAPIAQGVDVKTCPNTPLVITLRGNDPCPQADPLTLFEIVDEPIDGDLGPIILVGGSAATVTYTPNDPFTGQDQFTYRVRDRWKYSEPATVTITVGYAPVTENQTRGTHLGCPINIVLTADGCKPLLFTVESQPTLGVLCGTAPTLTYDPFAVGLDNFYFKVTDGVNESYGYVTIEVRPSNDNTFWTDLRSPEELATLLSVPGETVANVTYTGALHARGVFGGGLSAGLPFESGVILSSGNIHLAAGPNDVINAGAGFQRPGDESLDQLLGPLETETGTPLNTKDAAVLKFDITPVTNMLQFEFVFASEEYPEWLIPLKCDAVAIFVNGQNIAWVPNAFPPIPVCVFTVNEERNSDYYQENPLTPNEVFNLQYDGFTSIGAHPWLTASVAVQQGVPAHVKIVIADEDDWVFDSAVFIRAKRTVTCAAPCP